MSAQSGPNPNQPYIQSISYGGTGCPNGSVGSSMASDRLSFTLIFDRFIASTGSGIPVTEARKNCQLNLNVRVPQGSGRFCAQYSYRGYVQIPTSLDATQKATYYEAGSPLPPTVGNVSTFAGPVSRDYVTTDATTLSWDFPDGTGVLPLNINSEVRLSGSPSLSGQITEDSIDGKIEMGPCPGDEDTTAPTISIATPVLYGMYGLGASVAPQFTCTDETGGSGVASCTGAATLDTSSIGPKSYTVTAVDNAGNTSTASVTYAVGGKEECKAGGHSQFLVPSFKNQGLCVSTYSGKK
jgi:hypothetical protein